MGIFNPRIGIADSKVEGATLVDRCYWCGKIDGGSDVSDFDLGGLGGGTAIFVGNGEGDMIVTVIGIGMGGVLPDKWAGTIAKIPGVGEIGTTTAIFGCGG